MSAEAEYENAKLTRKVAEIAVVEYTEGIYRQDKATLEGGLKLAESDVPRAEERIEVYRAARQDQESFEGLGSRPGLRIALEDRVSSPPLTFPESDMRLIKPGSNLDRT